MRKPVPLVLTILAVALLMPLPLAAQSATCPLGYTVVFFNGVGNSYPTALASMHTTQAAIQESQHTSFDVYDAEDVEYKLAYNTTAAQGVTRTDLVNTTILQDIAEVFVQRARELDPDPSGTLGNNFFYMFWEWNNGVPQNYSNALVNNSLTNNMFTRFVNAAVTAAVGQLAALYGIQAPTAADYADQEATLTAAASRGRKLLLVAHSQGNLFVNHAHDFILPVVGAARLRIVHVAPASVIVWGDYELSANDVIINGLRLVNGFASIVDPNINPPYTGDDPTGHGYNEIYLSATLVDSLTGQPDRPLLESKFTAALTALDQQQCTLAISPQSSTIHPGDPVPLAATLSPPLNDAQLEAINYKWTISGNAGGTFRNTLLGVDVTTLVTTTPTITYNSSPDAALDQTDSVTVEMDVSTVNDNNATSKDLADTSNSPAIIKFGNTNECYSKVASISNPGSTYSVTLSDVMPGDSGTIQMDYTWIGNVAFADPPFTSTAYEYDVASVFTYPAPSVNSRSNVVKTFGSAVEDASYVIYGDSETSTSSTGTTTQIAVVTNPPLPFGQLSLALPGGPPISLLYSGTGVTGGGTAAGSYTESWQLVGTPTLSLPPAGTFKTCQFQITSSLSPNVIDTKWLLSGYGLVVQETKINTSTGTPVLQDTREATALSINGARYTGP